MYTLGRSLTLTGLLFLPVPPLASPAPARTPAVGPPAASLAENINIVDFASNLAYSLTDRPPVRRNNTSVVTIKKHLINLVPFGMVSVSGAGAQISNLSNGTSSDGTGFIAMRLTVSDANAPLGELITLSVGATDRFTFRVVNRGTITGITKNPDPTTLQPGAEWTATVSGTDLGTPVVAPINCHTVTESNRSNSSVQFRLRRAATCSTTSFNFRLAGSAQNDPPTWTTSTGGASSFGFAYLPPPPSGVVCTSIPTITAPVITQPLNNQVIEFGSGTASPGPVQIVWEPRTQPGNILPPNGEWLVTRSAPPLTPGLGGKGHDDGNHDVDHADVHDPGNAHRDHSSEELRRGVAVDHHHVHHAIPVMMFNRSLAVALAVSLPAVSLTIYAESLVSLSVSPSDVITGGTSNGTVTVGLTKDNVTVQLASAEPRLAAVPPSVSLKPGTDRASFSVRTLNGATGCTELSATMGGVTKRATIFVLPPPTPSNSAVTVTVPATAVAGQTVQGSVVLLGESSGPRTVQLASSHPAVATVPASVSVTLVPSSVSGVTTNLEVVTRGGAGFPITTNPVNTVKCSVITATSPSGKTSRMLIKVIPISG